MNQNKLGNALRVARLAQRLTLRAVEKKSKKKISNSYISQLEFGGIEFPHPDCLRTLASLYKVSFVGLLILAGYVTVKEIHTFTGRKV